MFKRRILAASVVALAAVVAAGCTQTLQPRTSAELPYKGYKKLGAVADASRAYPLAFYADPTLAPTELEVGFGLAGAKVLAAQWLTHLAAKMNQALHEVGLYDRRFAGFAHQVFRNQLSSGDYVYLFKDDGSIKRDIEVSGARLAKLRIKSMTTVTVGSERMVRLTVEVTIGGLPRMYQADGARGNWDQQCFDGIARKILSDPGFWRVVAQSP